MSKILSLPAPALSQIYTSMLGSDIVEIKVDEQGKLLTSACRLLRVCNQLRQDILGACSNGHLRLVHTVTSPAALTSLMSQASSGPSLQIRNLRCVLLTELEAIPLTEKEELGYGSHPNIAPLFREWREAFKSIPKYTTITLVYFDLVRSFNIHTDVIGRLINCLSAILRQRSGSQARCRILGCFTTHGQRFFEDSAVNIDSKIDLQGKKPKPSRERRPEGHFKPREPTGQVENQFPQEGTSLPLR